VAVRGTTIRGTAALRIVTGTRPTTGTTTSVFGLSLLRPALFCVRTDGWEFIGHIKEESRPTPVRSKMISENQTESDSLVGFIAEQLSDLLIFLSLSLSVLERESSSAASKRYKEWKTQAGTGVVIHITLK
jgi:hypothetical protein